MTVILLALASGVSFGAMTVALRLGLRDGSAATAALAMLVWATILTLGGLGLSDAFVWPLALVGAGVVLLSGRTFGLNERRARLAAFALVVVSFVRLAGVLLTFAYLIVPAVCGTMLAQRWGRRLIIGWVVAVTASLLGLWASYQMDLPTGAAIVCASGLLLVIVGIIASVRGSDNG